MLEQFKTYNEEQNLFEAGDRIVVAVSGGVDSCVLLHLLMQCKVEVVIAHCNFGLRGNESNDDEVFCRELSELYNLPIEVKSFQKDSFAVAQQSTQMIARDLRYDWFSELSKKYNAKIAVGTHLDDSLETFFINLLRGSGPKGLRGIQAKRDNIIRPLLFAYRRDILAYAHAQGLAWREDSSNNSDKYLRNYIRHHIVPSLHKAKENGVNGVTQSMSYLDEVSELVSAVALQFVEEAMLSNNGGEISIEKLLASVHPLVIIREVLSRYGFNPTQASQIFDSIDSQGAQFSSSSHHLIVDRGSLRIGPIQDLDHSEGELFADTAELRSPIGLTAKTIDSQDFEIIRDSWVGQFDYDELSFPLKVRRWQQGDRIKPLGMQGSKLVSDILIDEKVNRRDKDETYVLESNGEIVWLIGLRINRKFAVSNKTKKVYLLQSL